MLASFLLDISINNRPLSYNLGDNSGKKMDEYVELVGELWPKNFIIQN